MKILIQLQYLIKILLLHFRPCLTHFTFIIWVEKLVYDNVSDVNVKIGQLLDQSFCLVHGKKFWYAYGDECCFCLSIKKNNYLIFHLRVYFCWDVFHLLHLGEDIVNALIDLILWPENTTHTWQNVAELFFQCQQLAQSLLQNIWEVQESQRMSSWRSIKHNNFKFHLFNWTIFHR